MAIRHSEEIYGPARLNLLAEMDGMRGDAFEFLEYFADLIEELGRKPWGRKGKGNLLAAINLLHRQYDYQRWVTCKVCHTDFSPKIDVGLVDFFLLYRKEVIDFEDLYLCKDCGGIAYVEKLRADERQFSEDEVLTILTDAFQSGVAVLRSYINTHGTNSAWGTVVIVSGLGNTPFIEHIQHFAEQQALGHYDPLNLPFTLSVTTYGSHLSIDLLPKEQDLKDILWNAYEMQKIYSQGIIEALYQYEIDYPYLEHHLD